MPHLQIEYSANLEPDVDMSAFCEALRQSASQIEEFPLAGIRVRAIRVDHYAIADGNPDHGFVDISVRLRGGRPIDVRKDATQRLFEAAQTFLEAVMARRPVALSLEMRDIDPELSPKCGSIRNHLVSKTN
ncbi:5-carboxymethyl-2-hydroxymuconate Delta-isomerase [Roseibium sp.]|uniref:5-carboxymethyl-2-hydroxymuconate Delta-isomerase n=1 Tax=Roseibium sp. TaxID=1936156 RepID=UPI003A977A4B